MTQDETRRGRDDPAKNPTDLRDSDKPENRSAPDPHSPAPVQPDTVRGPESGGYEKNAPDSASDNAKGGYGAG